MLRLLIKDIASACAQDNPSRSMESVVLPCSRPSRNWDRDVAEQMHEQNEFVLSTTVDTCVSYDEISRSEGSQETRLKQGFYGRIEAPIE
jgi:hypothetical protein